jgi:membrane associated rhomboid family serine protease
MFFPYDDINPTDSTPYVTYCLIAANIVAFIATFQMLTLPPEQQLAAMEANGALIPADLETTDIFTSMFLHGGLGHLGGNMLFLWITGDNIEDEFGSLAFIVFYLFCGVASAFSHIAIAPDSSTPLVGASGAISGLMGAYIVLYPNSRIKIFYWFYFLIGQMRLRAIWWLGLWFGFQLIFGAAAGVTGGGVAYAAHIGGFVVGAAIALAAMTLGWVEGGVDDEHFDRPGQRRL